MNSLCFKVGKAYWLELETLGSNRGSTTCQMCHLRQFKSKSYLYSGNHDPCPCQRIARWNMGEKGCIRNWVFYTLSCRVSHTLIFSLPLNLLTYPSSILIKEIIIIFLVRDEWPTKFSILPSQGVFILQQQIRVFQQKEQILGIKGITGEVIWS